MKIINLTPHVLNIFLPTQVEANGRTLKVVRGVSTEISLPSVGFARAKEMTERLSELECNAVLLPVVRKRFTGVVEGLPEPTPGTIYVVSFLTAQAVPDRADVFFPGEAVRDDDGNIVGCLGLAHA